MVMLKSLIRPVITEALGSHWGKLVFSVVHAVYYIALFPLAVKVCGRWMNRRAA